jgi:hypothetical protein
VARSNERTFDFDGCRPGAGRHRPGHGGAGPAASAGPGSAVS